MKKCNMLTHILLKITCIYYFLLVEGHGINNALNKNFTNKTKSRRFLNSVAKNGSNCWMTMNAKQHFKTMEKLEEMYSKTKDQYEKEINSQTETFDNQTLTKMLNSRGRIEGKGIIMDQIQAGINLGGYSMLRHERSVLFFHRMKLRNSTKFRINRLHTDLGNMVLSAQLSLHDLHLLGSYERAFNNHLPYNLFYIPTYGLIEILLKDVVYVMEGRLRFLHDSPYIVLVNSALDLGDAMLLNKNNASNYDKPLSIRKSHIEDFLDRMKSDLDSWLKDFFNHYLIFYKPISAASEKFRDFQTKRTIALNEYMESALKFMRHRIHKVNASAVMLPKFNIITVDGMKIQLVDGVLRGLDSIYRRSIATGTLEEDKIRKIDTIVGFSNLKVIYKYTTFLTTGIPPLNGLLILSANDLTAHMSLKLLKFPETVDLTFESIQELKEKSLTVEGAANKIVSNFKHILEHHIVSIMSNVLIHNIRALSTLTKCEPSFFGIDDSNNNSETDDEIESSGDPPNDMENTDNPENHSLSVADPLNQSENFEYQNNVSNVDSNDAATLDAQNSDSQNNDNFLEKDPYNAASDFENSDENNQSSRNNDKNYGDYVINKEDSIELQLAPNANTGKANKYHFLAKESLSVKKFN